MKQRLMRNWNWKLSSLEALEQRLAFDAGSTVWGSHARFTLSFVPDGTSIAGEPSSLFDQMDSLAETAVWQGEIMRAFQTWARETNSDIGFVPDSGELLGVHGAMRGDSRFGDIRIGARPLSEELFAVAVPGNEVVDGTWIGDVVFNSELEIQSVDALFAIALHEAGHVFGLPHSADPLSPMYTHGIPAPNARIPTMEDLNTLHSLFGTRQPDVYDSAGEPGAIEIPPFRLPGESAGSAPSVVFGDISSDSDVDEFFLEIPDDYVGAGNSLTVEVVCQGVSALAADFSIHTFHSNLLLGSASTTWESHAEIHLDQVYPGDKFRIYIASNGEEFSVGGYSLVVTYDEANHVTPSQLSQLLNYPVRQLHMDDLKKYFLDGFQLLVGDDDGTNDDEGNEQELSSTPGYADNLRYAIEASMDAINDQDRYVVQSPDAPAGSGDRAQIRLLSLDPVNFWGKVKVFDEGRNEVAIDHLVHNDEYIILQFGPVNFSSEYFVDISASDSSPVSNGGYRLEVEFGLNQVLRHEVAHGMLTASNNLMVYRLRTHGSQLFHFALDSTQNSATNGSLRMTIRGNDGQLMESLVVQAGEVRSRAVYLPKGLYRLAIELTDPAAAPITYRLVASGVYIPLGPRANDSTEFPFHVDLDRRLYFARVLVAML